MEEPPSKSSLALTSPSVFHHNPPSIVNQSSLSLHDRRSHTHLSLYPNNHNNNSVLSPDFRYPRHYPGSPPNPHYFDRVSKFQREVSESMFPNRSDFYSHSSRFKRFVFLIQRRKARLKERVIPLLQELLWLF
jgi:hypothetical protein